MVEVSVIIPCFNEENFIKDSILSVLEQTYKDFEIIIVDDCSEDKSVAIVESFIDIYPSKIKLLKRKENGGISISRNAGIIMAEGKYICMLSGDDMFKSDYLESMIKFIQKYPDEILYSNYDFINHSGSFIRKFNAVDYEHYEELYLGMIERAKINDMQVNFSTIFAKAEIFKENLFWDELRFGEDLEWMLRLCLVENKFFRLVKKSLVRYRLHQQSTTNIEFNNIALNNDIVKKRINEMMHREIFADEEDINY